MKKSLAILCSVFVIQFLLVFISLRYTSSLSGLERVILSISPFFVFVIGGILYIVFGIRAIKENTEFAGIFLFYLASYPFSIAYSFFLLWRYLGLGYSEKV